MAAVEAGHVSSALRRGGLAGMLMYPVFVLTVVILTWLEWDFLHGLGWTVRNSGDVNFPSGLARGDYGVVQALNFVLLGVFGMVFLLGLRTQFVHRRLGMAATIALGTFACAGILNAMPTDLPGELMSWHGVLHGIGFLLTMLGALVGIMVAGFALTGSPGWRGYAEYSIVTTPVAILAAFGLSFLDQIAFYVLLTILLAWFAVMGIHMRRLAARSSTPDGRRPM